MAKRKTRKKTSNRTSFRRSKRVEAVKRAVDQTGPAQTLENSEPTVSDLLAAPDPHTPTIVGVGASAGGLEAFSQLLEALPATADIAIVFVQHLSPQHESALPSLLASKTPVPIVQVTEGLTIEPRHVYVIPPNVQMGVVNGRLHLLPRPYDRSQFTPIDFFLQSLARWAQNRAIGVILSGTASDGAAGIREIKAAGGITIAQNPRSAKYDGMPRSAIATGMIDLVLTPQEIAEQLSHIQTHPYLGDPTIQPAATDIITSEEQLNDIFAMLRRVSGIDFRQYKTPTIKRRLLRRMALHRQTDFDAYARFLRESPKEVTALYQDLLIHVTRFFREPESFTVLAEQVFAELANGRRDEDPIRIWVPGCATGEEAYSVAISLMEALGEQGSARRIQLFATDVSETAIEHARAGIYPISIAADVTPERLKRFFTKMDGQFKVNKSLRDVCVFARHDLTRDPPFSRMDLIMCRNVMIYLDVGLQKRLVTMFHYAIKPDGFLMLGAAETTGHQHLFSIVDKRWRLYRKVAVDTAAPITFSMERFSPLPIATHSGRQSLRSDSRTVQDEANRLLLQRYSPPSVVIDENHQIVQFRGQTGHFLEPASGEPNLNVLKMAREGLLFPLRSALQSARRKHRTVRKENVMVRRNGDWHNVNLEVMPLSTGGAGHMVVTFEEATRMRGRARVGGNSENKGRQAVSRRDAEDRVAGLTRELAASREYLQSIIQELEAANEELQSANEEILSSNEELQSTNEELDTAKEELQSTNEELNTVNEELHSRNEELSRSNSDLVNLLVTVDLTILIVGEDMRIRRFTPSAERVLNLIPGDVGRPVGQINTNLAENLEALVRETIDTMTPRELEVQDRQERWYSLRIRPYKNTDNRIDGAVLTLVDIGAVKKYQEQIERSRDYLLGTISWMREPVLVLDDGNRVKIANQAFYQTFTLKTEDVTDLSVFELDGQDWNIPRLRALLQQLADSDGPVENVSIDHEFRNGGRRRLIVSGRRIPLEEGKHLTVLSLDVSNAKSKS